MCVVDVLHTDSLLHSTREAVELFGYGGYDVLMWMVV